MYHIVHFWYDWAVWKQFLEFFVMLLYQHLKVRDLIIVVDRTGPNTHHYQEQIHKLRREDIGQDTTSHLLNKK